MKIRLKSILYVALTIVAGALTGFFLETFPFRLGFVNAETIRTVRDLTNAVFGDNNFSYLVSLAGILSTNNFPGIFLFGILVGICLHWIRFKRTFLCSMPLWQLPGYAVIAIRAARWDGEFNPYAGILASWFYKSSVVLVATYVLFLAITCGAYLLARAIKRKRYRDKGLNQTLPPI